MTTITSKAYTAKSSATRAAKKDYSNELANGSAIIKQLDDGMWVFEVTPVEAKERDLSPAAKELTDAIKENKKAKLKAKNADLFDTDAMNKANAEAKKSQDEWVAKMNAPAKDYMTEAKKEGANVLTGVEKQPSDKVLKKELAKAAKIANRDNKEVDSQPSADTIANDPARAHAEALGIDGLENLAKDAKLGNISRVSDIERPCDRVWAIADAMQGERRKDIIAACVDQGVAYYTARTQYQHWFTAKKNDQAAAERAAAKKAAK